MFGKDKVKAHNRLSKGKNGFRVIRVDDFFRKKDEDNLKRNPELNKKIALGVGAGLLVAGGSALLLKKKGIKFPSQVGKEAKDLIVDVKAVRVPDSSLLVQSSKKIKEIAPDNALLTQKTKKVQNLIDDPWETPILTKIQKESSLVTAKTDSPKLLAPAKKSTLGDKDLKKRGSLFLPRKNTRDIEERVMQVSNAQRDYKSLPVEMQAILQIEKSLRAPTQVSRLGRPPETTSIVQLVDKAQDGKLDKVVRKTKDRLVREKTIADDVASRRDIELKKN